MGSDPPGKSKARTRLKNVAFTNFKNTAVKLGDGTSAAFDGCHFDGNGVDIEGGSVEYLEVTDTKFSKKAASEKKEAPRKYFGGFSFSKGDHRDK